MPIGAIQSSDELINQEFIRITPRTSAPSGPFQYDYKGFHGCDSHCQIEIVGNIVIATEVNDNQGTSITYLAEHLATRIAYQYQIPINQFTWIEHYPARGEDPRLNENYSIVKFAKRNSPIDPVVRFVSPSWTHMERKEVKEMLKQERLRLAREQKAEREQVYDAPKSNPMILKDKSC